MMMMMNVLGGGGNPMHQVHRIWMRAIGWAAAADDDTCDKLGDKWDTRVSL